MPGVHEVLHAEFFQHAYPMHTHSEWTLLLVDSGVVAYELGRTERFAAGVAVTVLPPNIAHDGHSAVAGGFRKRVVYLDEHWLPAAAVGLSVDRPTIQATALVSAVRRLHGELVEPGSELAADTTLLRIREAVLAHLDLRSPAPPTATATVAADLRDLLDERVTRGIGLAEAGALLGAHPSSLGRAFREAYGIAPHAYLVSRRVDRARQLLRDGWPVAEVAVVSGFHDQAHLTRHFTRLLGITPGRYRLGRAA